MPVISITNSIRPGIQAALSKTWEQEFPEYKIQKSWLLHFLPWVSIRHAEYGFKERVPMIKPWPYGTGRIWQTFKDRRITVSIFPYDLSQMWSGWDAEDDQIGDLPQHVASGMKRFVQLPDVLFSEYLTGVKSLNPELTLAYDGVPTCNAVDGDGEDRFGVAGGNIVIGSGVATHAQIVQDMKTIRRRFLEMQEPVTGMPLHVPSLVSYEKIRYIIPTALDGVFKGIADQDMIYTDPNINTAQSNFLKGKIKFEVNQYLTDVNDWYAIIEHNYWKAFGYRGPESIDQIRADMSNSDHAREFNELGSLSHCRVGLSPWATFCIIKVAN